jgi:Protein of unknown function (DUF2911)
MRNVKLAMLLSATIISFISCTQNEKVQAPIVISPTEIPKQIIEPANTNAEVDKSPVDISYYPVNYPKQLMEGNDSATLTARVIYSRPHKANRQIFSNDGPPKSILQYGDYWRLGANEATEIEFFKPTTINGQKILKGRYIIYCIPHADKWTIVLNSNLFSFGLHQDAAKDVIKVEIPVQQSTGDVEYFTMVFQKSATGANLIMAWGNVKASLPLSF